MATVLLLMLYTIALGTIVTMRRGYRVPLVRSRRLLRSVAPIAPFVLVAGFALQIAVAYGISAYDAGQHPWLAALPIRYKWYGPTHTGLTAALGYLAVLLETAALAALALGGSSRRGRMTTAVALVFLAVSAPTLTTSDPYYYAVAGVRGLAMYRTDPSDVLPFAFLEEHLFLRGSLYGPLWILSNSAITSLGSTLFAKIVLMRLTGVALVFAGAGLVRRAGFGRAVQTAFLLNPMIWWYFVVNAHNDIEPTLLVLGASACVRAGRPAAAAALVAAAGCFKLPFVLIGLVVFARLRSARERALSCAVAVVACVTISALLGGRDYLAELVGYSQHPLGRVTPGPALPIVGGSALLAILVAVLRRRLLPPAAWFMLGLTPLAYPWYFIWGIPYAATARRGFLKFLLLLPCAALLLDALVDPFVPAVAAAVWTAVTMLVARRSVEVLRPSRTAGRGA